jgi:biopolymer transport protein ExbB
MKACSPARRLWWVGFLLDSVSRKHNMGISAQGYRLRLGVFFVLCLVVVSVLGPAGPAVQSARAQPPEGEAADQAKDKEKKDEAPRSAGSNIERTVEIGIYGLLTITSIAMVTLIVLLFLELRMSMAVPPAFVEDFTQSVNARKFKEAFEMSKNETSFLGRALTSGMARLQYGIEDAREASMAMVDTVKAKKEQLITYLATIGTLGPLLGLVGTVFGMIISFKELGREGVAPKPAELARGISTALRLTLFGVGLAVPAIFFHSFFRNRLIGMANDTSNVADDLLTQMYHNSKRPAVGADARPPSSASIKT